MPTDCLTWLLPYWHPVIRSWLANSLSLSSGFGSMGTWALFGRQGLVLVWREYWCGRPVFYQDHSPRASAARLHNAFVYRGRCGSPARIHGLRCNCWLLNSGTLECTRRTWNLFLIWCDSRPLARLFPTASRGQRSIPWGLESKQRGLTWSVWRGGTCRIGTLHDWCSESHMWSADMTRPFRNASHPYKFDLLVALFR